MHLFNSSHRNRWWQVSRIALMFFVTLTSFQSLAQTKGKERSMEHPTFYRNIQIDGLSIFYREAGPKDAPTILLLHGLPSSSRMFEPLFARLSDSYHLIAPDYPGFGHSDWPDPKKFAYTFDHIAEVMDHFTEELGVSQYTLYMQDYGGPVGFRMALAHPERAKALIVQNAVAHNTGLGENWKTRRAFWADRTANESALRRNLLSLETTKARHAGNDPNVARHDPDLWMDEFYFLDQPGQADIQSDLFYDYRTNVDAYPKWQAWMREKQPHLLVIWGKYESSFDPSEEVCAAMEIRALTPGYWRQLPLTPETMAALFHEGYTRLAPKFKYKIRDDSHTALTRVNRYQTALQYIATHTKDRNTRGDAIDALAEGEPLQLWDPLPWDQAYERNRKLTIAVCEEMLEKFGTA